MNKISVVVPCFNEEEVLSVFYKKTSEVLNEIEDITYELLFVDDGSKDHTKDILRALSLKDEHCEFISFSRNFGKEAAMFAGLKKSSGNYVVIMDADLQHPPVLLKEMYKAVSEEGYDCCAGKRVDRTGEGKIRNFLSHAFYKVMQKMCKMDMSDGCGDFRMMSRQMVDAILELKEYNRYMKGLFSFVGFDTKWIEYENVERVAGETKWSFWKLFKYALEGITAFSTTPLIFSSIVGLIFCLVAFIAIIFIIVKTLVYGDPTAGWPSMACIIVFVSGIQLFTIGIIGQYLSKTYLEVKKRPIYIIKETEKDYTKK